MAGLSDLAASMLAASQGRLEVVANNVSNIGTPGFRSRRIFQQVMDGRQALPVVSARQGAAAANAPLKVTGNPLDIAITGGGALLLREGDRLTPAFSGQFHRAADGRIADAAGRVLQAAGGGDLVVSGAAPVLLKDGTLLVEGQAEARIGAFALDPSDPDGLGLSAEAGLLSAEADGAALHQGMTIPSDVDLGTEMVEMTRAARMAETGARVFQVYDDLMGRVATKLGEVGR